MFLSPAAFPQPSQSSGECPVEVNASSLNSETYPGCKARTTLEGLRGQFDSTGFWALAMAETPTASGKLFLVDTSQDGFLLRGRGVREGTVWEHWLRVLIMRIWGGSQTSRNLPSLSYVSAVIVHNPSCILENVSCEFFRNKESREDSWHVPDEPTCSRMEGISKHPWAGSRLVFNNRKSLPNPRQIEHRTV